MVDLHPQDRLLSIEGLVSLAGNSRDLDGPREERAWEQVKAFAATEGLSPSETIRQIDDDWRG